MLKLKFIIFRFELNEVEPTTIVTDEQGSSKGVSGVDKVEIIKVNNTNLKIFKTKFIAPKICFGSVRSTGKT